MESEGKDKQITAVKTYFDMTLTTIDKAQKLTRRENALHEAFLFSLSLGRGRVSSEGSAEKEHTTSVQDYDESIVFGGYLGIHRYVCDVLLKGDNSFFLIHKQDPCLKRSDQSLSRLRCTNDHFVKTLNGNENGGFFRCIHTYLKNISSATSDIGREDGPYQVVLSLVDYVSRMFFGLDYFSLKKLKIEKDGDDIISAFLINWLPTPYRNPANSSDYDAKLFFFFRFCDIMVDSKRGPNDLQLSSQNTSSSQHEFFQFDQFRKSRYIFGLRYFLVNTEKKSRYELHKNVKKLKRYTTEKNDDVTKAFYDERNIGYVLEPLICNFYRTGIVNFVYDEQTNSIRQIREYINPIVADEIQTFVYLLYYKGIYDNLIWCKGRSQKTTVLVKRNSKSPVVVEKENIMELTKEEIKASRSSPRINVSVTYKATPSFIPDREVALMVREFDKNTYNLSQIPHKINILWSSNNPFNRGRIVLNAKNIHCSLSNVKATNDRESAFLGTNFFSDVLQNLECAVYELNLGDFNFDKQDAASVTNKSGSSRRKRFSVLQLPTLTVYPVGALSMDKCDNLFCALSIKEPKIACHCFDSEVIYGKRDSFTSNRLSFSVKTLPENDNEGLDILKGGQISWENLKIYLIWIKWKDVRKETKCIEEMRYASCLDALDKMILDPCVNILFEKN